MGVGVGIGVGVGMAPSRSISPPAEETLVRTVVGESTVGEPIACQAAVGDLIVIYAAGSTGECFSPPAFQAVWNGLAFTSIQRLVEDSDGWGGERAQAVAIATLLVPAGKAGDFMVSYDWAGDEFDANSVYVERWAGVASGIHDRVVSSSGTESDQATGATTPTTNHTLALGALYRDGIPVSEGSWLPGLTETGHIHAPCHLCVAYDIQTVATRLSFGKGGVTTGQFAAIGVMLRAT